jgi:hypothetical protein
MLVEQAQGSVLGTDMIHPAPHVVVRTGVIEKARKNLVHCQCERCARLAAKRQNLLPLQFWVFP